MMSTDASINISIPQLQAFGQTIALSVVEQMGVNTLISYRQGESTYGKFFKDAVASGKLTPASIGNGKNGKRLFAVRDIIALRAEEEEKAALKF